MTLYRVISAENKGVYKKGELIRIVKIQDLNKIGYKGVDISKISYDNGYKVEFIPQ